MPNVCVDQSAAMFN